MTKTKLDALRRYTVIVADSGEIDSIREFTPQDCTTNPTLILKAARMPAYARLVRQAIDHADKESGAAEGRIDRALDHLAVAFGTELSHIVPGYVSTEVDARLSFDTLSSVAKAERLLGLYADRGVTAERILIKVAATWEGIRAAAILEKRGIHCNVTLVFSLAQAVAAAEAGAFLISPFVGRILDWHVKASGKTFTAAEDPGVRSVKEIYDYFKHFEYPTIVMGASFRSRSQVEALCGCDRLTVSPALLEELRRETGDLPRQLDPATSRGSVRERISVEEASFRWLLNQDAMATEKLEEGIRQFHGDTETLRRYVGEIMRARAHVA